MFDIESGLDSVQLIQRMPEVDILLNRNRCDTVCKQSEPLSALVGEKDGNNFIKYFQMSSLRVLDNTKFYRSLANDDDDGDGDDVRAEKQMRVNAVCSIHMFRFKTQFRIYFYYYAFGGEF